ncbi:lysylphosphatidylglycerol synthase transmembrane domain-containing protein [Paractinoplanes globisporus]|uniref:YbhN family protein n=1 Tax=Paractinoplanes globisporus TaxID=113565 RepID=A0ABW6W8N5_9ACTN|nr:lysylphosphatidylglycerol synthase transmembrane domain-containing protein [Actinoplanes globisporus]
MSARSGVSAVRGWQVALLPIALAVAAWAAVRAATAGASFTTAIGLIGELTPAQVLGLGLVWFLGLYAHAIALAASLPGLTRLRALTLNLTGSAVSNVLPLGGLAGAALNLTMIRSWGHGSLDFARFVVVSKSCDVITKLLLPAVALLALLSSGALAPASAGPWTIPAAVAFAAGCLLLWALCGRATPLLRLVELAGRACSRLTRRTDRPVGASWRATVLDLLAGVDRIVRQGRVALTLGMAGYWLGQGALLWCCLRAVGVDAMPAVVFAGLVAERLMTLTVVTPGGTGPAEAGMVAVLIALGADATGSLAGVLLFRAFVVVAAIPAGALAGLGWWSARQVRGRNPGGRRP